MPGSTPARPHTAWALLSGALLSGCMVDALTTETAVPGNADLRVSPEVLDLGTVTVGDRAEGTVSVGNFGDADAALGTRIEGTLAQTYSIEPPEMKVAADEFGKFTVVFQPEAWGDHSVVLTIEQLDGDAIFVVPITVRVKSDG